MRSTTIHVGMVAAVVLIALGLGLWLWPRQPSPDTASMEPLTIAAYEGAVGALVHIADAQGFFVEHGLAVTIKPFEAGKRAADALLAGEADVATASDVVLVSQSLQHEALRVLSTVALADTNELVARKDHGIHHPADLRGKTIGVTRQSAGEFYLGTFLTFQGLSMQDITVVDLQPSALVEALTHGEIDAALTWHPNVFHMKQRLGAQAISWPGQSRQDYHFLLLSPAEWIRTHPRATEGVLHALLRAEDSVRKHQAEAQAFIAR